MFVCARVCGRDIGQTLGSSFTKLSVHVMGRKTSVGFDNGRNRLLNRFITRDPNNEGYSWAVKISVDWLGYTLRNIFTTLKTNNVEPIFALKSLSDYIHRKKT